MPTDNVVVTVNCPHCGRLNEVACPVLHKIPTKVVAEAGDFWGSHQAKSYSACESCDRSFVVRWWL